MYYETDEKNGSANRTRGRRGRKAPAGRGMFDDQTGDAGGEKAMSVPCNTRHLAWTLLRAPARALFHRPERSESPCLFVMVFDKFDMPPKMET